MKEKTREKTTKSQLLLPGHQIKPLWNFYFHTLSLSLYFFVFSHTITDHPATRPLPPPTSLPIPGRNKPSAEAQSQPPPTPLLCARNVRRFHSYPRDSNEKCAVFACVYVRERVYKYMKYFNVVQRSCDYVKYGLLSNDLCVYVVHCV